MRKRITVKICASTEEHRSKVCKKIAYYERKSAPRETCAVLFMFGVPSRILTSIEVEEYSACGARIEIMFKDEVIIK
jgi:hypothetical protein